MRKREPRLKTSFLLVVGPTLKKKHFLFSIKNDFKNAKLQRSSMLHSERRYLTSTAVVTK